MLSATPLAHAAETTEPAAEPTPDMEVVVSATRTQRKAKDTPGSVSVRTAAELERTLSSDLGDTVRYEPDVSVQRSFGGGGPGQRTRSGNQGFNIRGIDGNRVLLQVDGIRQADQFTFGGTTSFGRDYLDVANYKRLEIVKGSASALYGSDAIGGVVTFTTLEPSDFLGVLSNAPYAFRLRAGYDGADRSFSETATAAFRFGRLEVLAQYTRRDGEELQSKDAAFTNPVDYATNSFLGKVVYRWNNEHTTRLTGEFLDRYAEGNLVSSRRSSTTSGTTTVIRDVPQTDQVNRLRLSLEHAWLNPVKGDAALSRVEGKVFYQNSRTGEGTTEFRTSIRAGRPDHDIRQFRSAQYLDEVFGGSLQLESRFTLGPSAHRLTYGLEASTSEVSRDRNGLQVNLTTGAITNFLNPDTFPVKDIPDTSIFRFGGYLQDEITLGTGGWLSLIPAIRFDHYDADPTDDAVYRNTSGQQAPIGYSKFSVSPKLAVLARLTPNLTVSAQYARGFRNPTPEDLNGTVTNDLFQYRTIANPNLKSETSDNFDLTFRADFPAARLLLTGYYNFYHDFIVTLADAGTTIVNGVPIQLFQSQNLNKAKIYGFEFKAEFPLQYYIKPLEGFTASVTFGRAIGRDQETGTPLNSVDPFKAVGALAYDAPNKRWGAQLAVTHAARKSGLNASSVPNQFVPGNYTTLDLIGYARVGKNVRVNAGLFNLTDRRYFLWQDVIGLASTRPDLGRFAQAGINAKVGVSLEF